MPLKPNSGAPPTPFSLDIPSDVLKSKPKSYSSLVLKFKTAYQNGTEFGVTSTEYLTLIEREHIVIQSDKAKYKPGNLVQFRVLMMDVNLIPFEATSIEYTIESPSNNKMAMKTLTNPGQVVTGSFPLDKYAEQGGWSISVEATTPNGKIEAVYPFDVEEYVLPTFEVKINTDRSFIIEGEAEDVPIKIDAIYTFGQPVKGDAKVTITKMPCSVPSYYGYKPTASIACSPFTTCPKVDKNGCLVPPEIELDIKKFDGSHSDSIPRDELKKLYDFQDSNWRCQCGKNLLIKASVIDKTSGEELGAESKLKVESQKYSVDFVYTPDARREGIPFEFIAQAKFIDGSLLDVDGKVTCNVEVSYFLLR